MKLTINWQNPVIVPEEVLRIQPTDLDNFYFGASDPDKTNLFFCIAEFPACV